MGRDTEFVFACELKQNTPGEVIDVLKIMVKETVVPEEYKIDINTYTRHPLFETKNWKSALNLGSAYFPGEARCSLLFSRGSYYLTVRSSVKNNYDDGVIEKFLNWIARYSESDGFLGYLYDDSNLEPSLIYFDGGQAFLRNFQVQPI